MLRAFKRSLSFLALSFFLVASPAAAAKRALFDNFHAQTAGNADWIIDTDQPLPIPAQSTVTASTPNNYWLGAISTYGISLVKLGYTVATNVSALTYQNVSNPYDLSNYDVLIVDEPNTSFSAAEAGAVLSFVRDGGGLVAISDHSGSDRNSDGVDSPIAWNALDPAHLLGVHFGISTDANNNIVQTSSNVNTTFGDSVITGIAGTASSFAFHNGTTMTLFPGTNPTVRGEVWMTGTPQGSTTGAMAASSSYGTGRVLFIGDSSPVDDGSAQPGNSSIFNGWGEAADSALILNGTIWATRHVVSQDTIPPVITVTSPNGGEDWKAGSTHAITWTASDNAGSVLVDLSLSLDSGVTWQSPFATNLVNTGSYAWTIAVGEGTAYRVRATARDGVGNTASDASNANFTVSKWVITSSAGSGGTISPSGPVPVAQGSSSPFTFSASTGFQLATVLVDGASVGIPPSYTFTNVAANHTIAVSFAVRTFAITATAGANGQISPAGTVQVPYGTGQAFAITPSSGYHVATVTVDGTSTGAVTSYTFSNVVSAHTIASTFAVDTLSLTVALDGSGNVTKLPDQAGYPSGTSVTLTAGALPGFHFANWTGDLTGTTNPATIVVTANTSIVAHFAPDQFAIATLAVVRGTILRQPDLALYDYLSTLTLTAMPAPGYAFSRWAGDIISSANPLSFTVSSTMSLDADFSPVIDLIAPNGSEVLTIGGLEDIQWAVSDSVPSPSVDIALSRNGIAGPFESIAAALPNSGHYTWTVNGPPTDSACVRVIVHDPDATMGSDTSQSVFKIQGVLVAPHAVITAFAIDPLSPNPVSDSPRVNFALPRGAVVRLSVLDLQGREVARLADGFLPAGRHTATWPLGRAAATPPGVYLVRFDTPEGTRVRRWVVER